jgi:hypothetical protein
MHSYTYERSWRDVLQFGNRTFASLGMKIDNLSTYCKTRASARCSAIVGIHVQMAGTYFRIMGFKQRANAALQKQVCEDLQNLLHMTSR